MQFFKTLILLALATVLLYCNNKNTPADASTAALGFEERSFKKQSSTCSGPDSMRCAKVEVTYPEAVAGDAAAVKAINDTIQYHVKMTLALGEEDPANIQEGVDRFIQSYEEYMLEDSTYITPWEVQTNGKVRYQSAKYVTIEIGNYIYTGGAHPSSSVDLLTFEIQTGKKLVITDLVTDTTKLKQIAELKFKAARELPTDANLIEEGFFWGGAFALPANVAITEQGLYLVYNAYEAAAYAVGPTEFTISKEELKGILKE